MSVESLNEWRKKLENISNSEYQSKQNTESDETGQTPTDEQIEGMMVIYEVVARARQTPFTTKSNFARIHANEVALAASEGFITTKLNDTTYTNAWMVTGEGLDFMEGLDDVFSPRH